jgi:hypothetical protein
MIWWVLGVSAAVAIVAYVGVKLVYGGQRNHEDDIYSIW